MAVFNEPTKWQTSLVNSGDANTIPQTTPAGSGEASFEEGFPQITQVPIGAGGQAPDRKDFNGLFKVLGDWIFFLQNGGLSTYSANFDYVVGRYVVYNNTLYKCIQANGASSTVVAPDSVSPLGSDYWKDIENQDSTSLIPNQLIVSPVPLTDANLHLLDGALLSGSGAYAEYVTMMGALHDADPTANIWTDEATWQASVTTYGSCGKFVYDSVNNTLRLPKYDARYFKSTLSASELGDLVESGAPNITGETGSMAWREHLPTGAFGISTSLNVFFNGTSSSALFSNFDASRSSSIYKDSATTIDTDAVKVYYYIVVGTVSKTEIQINIDNVMTDLANKADNDLSNVPSSKGILVESYVNGFSWYRKYSDGWCEQGGQVDNLVPSLNSTINFLVSFTNTNYFVNANQPLRSGDQLPTVGVSSKTATSFTLVQSSSQNGAGNFSVTWVACGYIS